MTTSAPTSSTIAVPPIPALRPTGPQDAPARPGHIAAAPEPGGAASRRGRVAPPTSLVDQKTALTAQEDGGANNPHRLSEDEQRQVRDMKRRDAEVRRHEQAHAAVGGQHAGAPSYQFERGPDGRNYAVGGHVSIDVSPVNGDPKATIRKMDTVRRAAMAPSDPSAQDRSVAAKAQQEKLKAQRELTQSRDEAAPAPGQPAGPADTAVGVEHDQVRPAVAVTGYGGNDASRALPLVSLIA